MVSRALALVLLAAGCSSSIDTGGSPSDMTASSGAPDLRVPRDAAPAPDSGATLLPDGATLPSDGATLLPDGATLPSDGATLLPADLATVVDLAAPADFAPPPDLSIPPDLLSCAPVTAAAPVDPWRVRVPGPAFNKILNQNNTDYLAGPNDYIRIGASLAWGGSVTFFGLTANPASNVIDANDTGRELQLALYDPARAMQPCAASATCNQPNMPPCANSISYLGWDPVQGGDRCGNGATVLSHGQSGDALRVSVQPLQWNPDWDHPNCDQQCARVPAAVTYTLDYRFVDQNVVEIAIEVSSQEPITHAPTGQEFPTLYVSHGLPGPDLPQLVDAAGNLVAINTPGNDGFYYSNFTSPANWVTWQNANRDYGVAIGMDQGVTGWQGWRGDGVKSPYFHNVRAQMSFGLSAAGTVRGISYLALGSFQTVQALMDQTRKRRPPFGVVDAPAAGPSYSYPANVPLNVAGWVLDTAMIANVAVEIDGAPAAMLPVGAARPDVCAVYPDYDGCPNVGYSGMVPTAGLSPCQHLLRVTAADADGNRTVLGERVIQPQ